MLNSLNYGFMYFIRFVQPNPTESKLCAHALILMLNNTVSLLVLARRSRIHTETIIST